MAELPPQDLTFAAACPDCGERHVVLPSPLPALGDDFDWRVRDYDGFRLAMLQELAARFPERIRWTPADLEVVIVEALAAVLDQLSDTLDRVSSEAYLESARRPESVRRHLALIGYDAIELAIARGEIAPDPPRDSSDETETEEERNEREKARRRRLSGYWLANPHAMEEARRAGPRSIHVQHRMVTVDDYVKRLEEHPLVLRAHAWESWTGSWNTVRVAIIAWDNHLLDDKPIRPGEQQRSDRVVSYPDDLWKAIVGFHQERELPIPLPEPPQTRPEPLPSIRTLLTMYVEVYRMAGQEVVLEDAAPVPVTLALSVRVADDFFQSEVRRAVKEALGTGPLGFFRPGRLQFGEDLHASDVIEVVMNLDGVESVCLNRFKRLGGEFPDQVASGRILLEGLEVAVCDNDPAHFERGYYLLTLHGGRKG